MPAVGQNFTTPAYPCFVYLATSAEYFALFSGNVLGPTSDETIAHREVIISPTQQGFFFVNLLTHRLLARFRDLDQRKHGTWEGLEWDQSTRSEPGFRYKPAISKYSDREWQDAPSVSRRRRVRAGPHLKVFWQALPGQQKEQEDDQNGHP